MPQRTHHRATQNFKSTHSTLPSDGRSQQQEEHDMTQKLSKHRLSTLLKSAERGDMEAQFLVGGHFDYISMECEQQQGVPLH